MTLNRLTLILFLLLTLQGCKDKETPAPAPVTSNFEMPPVEDIVMYEINPGAFSATKDLKGITRRLDSIKALGINTIWLMPTYPVGLEKSFGSPYCIRDYTAVNPSLGTLAELKSLVNEAHKRDIAVMLDWVANHTSWDHPWMQNKSWYTQDANGNVVSPAGTNWNDVADLNFNNAEMRQAMITAMKYWITEVNIDGYRCDAADYIPFDFWKQAIDTLTKISNKKLILLAEGARSDHFTSGFHITFSWNHLNAIKKVFANQEPASAIFTSHVNEIKAIPQGKEILRFTTNHDESNIATPITNFGGNAGALAASAITIFLDGVPLIYSGQEVGVGSPSTYTNSIINWTANPAMLTSYKKMLNFYNTSSAARKGILETFNDPNIVAFKKIHESEQILVIANTKNSIQKMAIPASLSKNWIDAFSNSAVTFTDTITLEAYEYKVLKDQI